MLGFAAVRAVLLMDASSVVEWLCCVCSQTCLGPGPRQRRPQVQEEASLPGMQWRAPQAVCISAAWKIRVPLVARQRQSPSAGLVSLHQREAQRLLCQMFFGQAKQAGTKRIEVGGAETFVDW